MFFKNLINFFHNILLAAVLLLPDSPFQSIQLEYSGFVDVMSYINYFVPVGYILAILSAYVSAVLTYYGVRWALKLARYV